MYYILKEFSEESPQYSVPFGAVTSFTETGVFSGDGIFCGDGFFSGSATLHQIKLYIMTSNQILVILPSDTTNIIKNTHITEKIRG